jgi:hypothetical protein
MFAAYAEMQTIPFGPAPETWPQAPSPVSEYQEQQQQQGDEPPQEQAQPLEQELQQESLSPSEE